MYTETIDRQQPENDVQQENNNRQLNEVPEHLQGRYFAPSIAVHELMDFSHHSLHPPVIALEVHAENEQTVYFRRGDDIQGLLRNPRRTKLMVWMEYNAQN